MLTIGPSCNWYVSSASKFHFCFWSLDNRTNYFLPIMNTNIDENLFKVYNKKLILYLIGSNKCQSLDLENNWNICFELVVRLFSDQTWNLCISLWLWYCLKYQLWGTQNALGNVNGFSGSWFFVWLTIVCWHIQRITLVNMFCSSSGHKVKSYIGVLLC